MRNHTRVATMWGILFRVFAVALALGVLVPFVDRFLGSAVTAYPDLDTGAVASILSIISGAMVTLAGLVFTALTTAMSLGITAMSVRIVPVFQGDRVIQWGLGAFTGTFVYSLLVALSIAVRDDAYRPWVGTVLAVAATLASGTMFIAVTVRITQQLNPGMLLRRLAHDGCNATRYDPARFHTHADVVETRAVPEGHEVRRRGERRPGGRTNGDCVLAVNTPRLLDCEDAWGMRVELVPEVGSPVPPGGLLFRTSAPTSPEQHRQLERAVAFGDILSPDNGPFGAIRAMVDTALKALSPAVNDPTRAVQALDQIEEVLVRLSPRLSERRRDVARHPEAVLLRRWGHTWEDHVAAATDEIRQFATTSVQVQRRLRALFTTLLTLTPPQQHPPLRERLDALDRGIDGWWEDPLDRRLAAGTDAQGLGDMAPRGDTGGGEV
ncbi:DUF2254 family protein [Kocuria sp.]|uniref:DUF2254 family protein n=1 Tax=Kocuria sp. TaxID=1871328 RepID=UPI0026DCB1A4|nr:DUF2254 family protein [Kocuria sp.]MDO4918420.1 DUF2254 family protein [Kocuria sp.]